MGNLSKNLDRSEIRCKCGKCEKHPAFDAETVLIIQELIDSVGQDNPNFDIRIDVHSGYRCLEYNRLIGSKDTSQHIKRKAIDFHLYDKKSNQTISPQHVYNKLISMYPDKYGIGNYTSFTHFDSRSTKARWKENENRKS